MRGEESLLNGLSFCATSVGLNVGRKRMRAVFTALGIELGLGFVHRD